MSWAAIAAAVVGAGVNAGVAYASRPDQPDPAKSSRRTVLADLKTLPGRRMVDQAARLGIAVDYPTGRAKQQWVNKSLSDALADGDITQETFDRYLKSGRRGRRTFSPDSVIKVKGKLTPETAHADFTGFGDADVQAKMARQMADIQAELSRKYGQQFVDEARKQQEMADPQGVAARRMLASEINRIESERQNAQRPVADRMDAQILQELQAGRGITPEASAAAADIVRRRAESGSGGNVDLAGIEEELTTGPRGQQRLQERLQKAMGWLSSGATPEDVDYRRRQQSMANMANFLSGRTPTAEFGALSGAQRGATPMAQGPALVGMNPNIQQFGQQAGIQQLNVAANQAANNVNPWFAGIAGLLKAGGAAAGGGAFG